MSVAGAGKEKVFFVAAGEKVKGKKLKEEDRPTSPVLSGWRDMFLSGDEGEVAICFSLAMNDADCCPCFGEQRLEP